MHWTHQSHWDYSSAIKARTRRPCVPRAWRPSMNKALPSVAWLASALVIGLSGPRAAAEQPIRIGTSLSITGKQYSAQGGYCREGYLLCQKHVNTQGGVLGRQIELVIYDDGSDDKTAGRNYEKLITEDKVDAVLG